MNEKKKLFCSSLATLVKKPWHLTSSKSDQYVFRVHMDRNTLILSVNLIPSMFKKDNETDENTQTPYLLTSCYIRTYASLSPFPAVLLSALSRVLYKCDFIQLFVQLYFVEHQVKVEFLHVYWMFIGFPDSH